MMIFPDFAELTTSDKVGIGPESVLRKVLLHYYPLHMCTIEHHVSCSEL